MMQIFFNPLDRFKARKIKRLLKTGKQLYEEKSYVKAFECFSQAAALHSPEAQYYLGNCYLNGHGVAFNLQEAMLWYESAASADWVDAAYMLSLLNMRGVPEIHKVTGHDLFSQENESLNELKSDHKVACFWAKKSAEQGSPEGQALYAYLLSEESIEDEQQVKVIFDWYDKSIAQGSPQGYMGKGLLLLKLARKKEDYVEAAKLLEVASKADLGTAIYTLAVMYETGEGVEPDRQHAVSLYKRAAELGIRDAQALYGVALKKGYGVEQNWVEAETWLRRAAIKGDTEAATVLADMLASGNENISPNYIEAAKWYQFAFQKAGHIGAAYSLGYLFLKGWGVSQSTEQAVELFKFSAKKGYLSALLALADLATLYSDVISVDEVIHDFLRPQAEQGNKQIMLQLAMALMKSNGLKKDVQKEVEARKWLQACCSENAATRYWYGRMLLQGIGGEKDVQGALPFIRSSAEEGFVRAELLWASLLLDGQTDGHGENHVKEALDLFLKAADKGNASAMFSLGALYGGGNHMQADCVEAQKWFMKAAELGHPKAQLMLGRYLSRGLAGVTDLDQARTWFEKALQGGEKEAEIELEGLSHLKQGEKTDQNKESVENVGVLHSDFEHRQDSEKQEVQKQVEIAPGLFIYE